MGQMTSSPHHAAWPNQTRRSGSKNGSPAADRAALAALYKAAHGDSWYSDFNGRPDGEFGRTDEGYPVWLSAAPLASLVALNEPSPLSFPHWTAWGKPIAPPSTPQHIRLWP